MNDYYCKNCNNMVGTYNDIFNCYYVLEFCDIIKSENFDSIFFLDCKNCNKFIGIKCFNVCEICFGKNIISKEKNLFNWFLKYKKIIPKFLNICNICNKKRSRSQIWFFEELTFYK